MPVARLRMRPWLEKQIESQTIPGLAWLNKEEMIFQIPWKHAARHGWDMNKDACLFRSWAIHTGRYKEGQKEPDPKTWKANFRCAMNSLPDIKEVKDKSVYKGSSAVRVYKMLPAAVKTEKKERKSKTQKDSKSKPRKKVDSSSADEVEEAVKHCQLPEDHSGYTVSDYSIQEATGSSDIGRNQDFTSSLSSWNDEMEMPLPDSTNDTYPFQVSPMPSSSEGDDEDLLSDEMILALLDTNTDWQQINLGSRGYFTNEPGTAGTFATTPNFEDLGEIQVRVTTDVKPIDFSWQELTAITCL